MFVIPTFQLLEVFEATSTDGSSGVMDVTRPSKNLSTLNLLFSDQMLTCSFKKNNQKLTLLPLRVEKNRDLKSLN